MVEESFEIGFVLTESLTLGFVVLKGYIDDLQKEMECGYDP